MHDSGGGSTNIEALEEIVSYYLENEKYEDALPFISLLLEFIPFSADTWQRKGIILNNLQQHEEALRCFDRAVGLNPVDVEILIGRGFTLDTLGLYDEAIVCYDKALSIDGSNEDALFSKALTFEVRIRFLFGLSR